MPMSIVAFLEGRKDFGKADLEKRDILALYRNDIMKIQAQYRSKVLAIFDQIPGLFSRHEKRVVFNRIAAGSSADQYEETFFWLTDSMVANECRRANDPNVGLSLTESDTYIKCYLGDTGLLVSHAFDENELLEDEVYKQILDGKLGLNEGMLYENVIAQMLTANVTGCSSTPITARRKSATTLKSTSLSPITARRNIKCTPLRSNPAHATQRTLC